TAFAGRTAPGRPWGQVGNPGTARLSHTLTRFDASGPDRLDELLMVLLVLIGVAIRELDDGGFDRVAVAAVRGDRDRISRSGVRPRQRPPARAGVEAESPRSHRLDLYRALHVAKLTPVEVPVVQPSCPTQVDVAGCLHHALPLHDPLAVLPVPCLG